MNDCLKIMGWSLLYYVATFAGAMMGFFHPFLWVYNSILTALLAAYPYFRLVKGWPVCGITFAPLILSVVLNMAMGEGDWLYAGLATVIGIVTEIIRKVSGNYLSRKSLIAGYMAFALLPFSNTLRMWIWPEQSMIQTVEEMGQVYADKMPSVLHLWMLAAGVLMTLCVAWGCGKYLTKPSCQNGCGCS